MKDFTYYCPTEVVFGKDAQKNTSELVTKYGGRRVLIVYGGGSAIRSGLLGQITSQLEQRGIAYESHGGVRPNPALSHVREGIAKAIAFGADFILAVGGGSAIDAAKAIAHGLKNPEADVWKFWTRELPLTQSTPVGVVLTIYAAGSETSSSAVITNDELGKKRGLNTEWNRPRFAVMNPELCYTLPKYEISCGITDILMHTLDRYFSPIDGNQITDEIAESLMRVVIRNGVIALREPDNYDAVSELMWCGSLSHNGLTGLGNAMDFSVHQLGHELGGRFDVHHGASLSAMWGAWASYCYPVNPERFARFARQVWGISEQNTEKAASVGIQETVKYFASIQMPTNIPELGVGAVSESVIDELANSCVFEGKRLVGAFKPLDKNDVASIYRLANKANS